MRLVLVSLLVAFIDLFGGVLGHHLVTSGEDLAGGAAGVVTGIVCLGIAFTTTRSMKEPHSTGTKAVAVAIQYLVVMAWLLALRTSDQSFVLRLNSAVVALAASITGAIFLRF